jgi:hypothetical protein
LLIVRGVNGEFRKELVPLEQMVGDADPDEWLEDARARLLFRSHSAMHKAIAEATSLKYDCIHKALSGKEKAKRVQSEIKYCLEDWLRDMDSGQDPDIDEQYRGVPVEMTAGLLPALERAFGTKEELYRHISERTGVKAGSVRRYFQDNGQLKYSPLSVYECARRLAEGKEETPAVRSYLSDKRTRQIAYSLAGKARKALAQLRMVGESAELEAEFKDLRRALIAAMKERRRSLAGVMS